jgi:CRP-like cAMP-binding protein
MALDVRALERFALWTGLPPALLAQVAACCVVLSAPAGQRVIAQGETCRGVFFVVSGVLRVFGDTEGGEEVLYGLIHAHGMFGELSVIDDTTHGAHIAVMEDAVLIRLPAEAAQQFFFCEPLVARRVMQHLSAMVRDSNRQRGALALQDAPSRLWQALQGMGRSEGNGTLRIQPLPTQAMLGQMCGLTRETVSRLLNGWERDGLLMRSNGGLQMPLSGLPGRE